MQRFSGKTAIVTGGSRGLGRAIAQRLVEEGANVVVTGRDRDSLDAAVQHLGPAHALGVAGDATDLAHQKSTIQQAIETFGGAGLLVNNAGVTAPTPVIDADLEDVRKVIEMNALSALSWTQQANRAWFADHGGAVVNVASIAALRAPTGPVYAISKALLTETTRALAANLSPHVRVNAVAPALVKTELAAPFYEGKEEEISAARYPLGRIGEPEDVSGPVAFLLSDDAAWITGHLLVIDGGSLLK